MRKFREIAWALSSTVALGTLSPAMAQESSPNSPDTRASDTDGEIVVTAQKREERLIDVPQSVSVLSGDTLASQGAAQFRDFAGKVPGLTFTTIGAGFTQVSLRGVTAGTDVAPTVGIYVDEVPYGSSTPFAFGGRLALDVGLFDIDRIEVLRGPQGTLYGASTMGGLLKYVTKQPSVNDFGGEFRTGLSATEHGGVNYNVAGALNVPLASDKAALRVSGFEAHDAGYIDNVVLGQKNVNRSDVYGGRFDLLLAPTDALDIRITGFLQNISRDGQATADYTYSGVPETGSLEQGRESAEPFDQEFRLISGTINYDAGPVRLTSVTSYQTMRTRLSVDITRTFAGFLSTPTNPVNAVALPERISLDKFTQELRVGSSGPAPLEWVIGGYYTHEKSRDTQEIIPYATIGGAPGASVFDYTAPSRYEEYALFGTLTYHITDRFSVSGGLRYAKNEQRYSQLQTGLFGSFDVTNNANDDVVTYLANARYRIGDNVTAYVRYATGYRPGGPNVFGTDPVTGQPIGSPTFEADTLDSYEAGIKGETADRRFSFDASVYRIDWDNIQVAASQSGFSVIANAPNGARIYGGELSLTARPTRGLTFSGAFAIQDAELRAGSGIGAAGESLPNVPRFTATLNADYVLMDSDLRPSFGVTFRTADKRRARFGAIGPAGPNYEMPAYESVDLRGSVDVGTVTVQLYVNNLFDERAQLSAYTNRGRPQPAIMPPRTIGLNVIGRF